MDNRENSINNPVEKIVKEYKEKVNGNPASAVYLLAKDILNHSHETQTDPSTEMQSALQKLYGEAISKYSAGLTGPLANCIQTGSLALAVKELYEWSRSPAESRLQLYSGKIKLRPMSENYFSLLDSPGGRG